MSISVRAPEVPHISHLLLLRSELSDRDILDYTKLSALSIYHSPNISSVYHYLQECKERGRGVVGSVVLYACKVLALKCKIDIINTNQCAKVLSFVWLTLGFSDHLN